MKLLKFTFISAMLALAPSYATAQFHPVQVTTQLAPPYAVYLADYATPGNDKLSLVVLQRDLTKPSYQIRLQVSIALNGSVIMRTSRTFNPPPITLDPGIPMVIRGTDLQPYLDSRNLDFIGYSRTEYERTRALPEGSYQICFTAYDYRRQDVPVSDQQNCSFYWLAKSEPPLINFPACGTSLPLKNPQQIVFSWLPRNTSSPNSSAETEYEFALYEMRPDGRDPNDVVLSSQPVYRTVTDMTQVVYGPAEPVLIQDLTYVWRVRAIDKNGKDQFRNSGHSEVCMFTYGGTDIADWQPIRKMEAEGESESKGKAWWEPQQVDGYRVNYKKTGSSHQWFSANSDKPEVFLFDLEPDTRYEVRVQPRVGKAYGPYSDIKEFKTLPIRVYECGESPGNTLPLGKPLLFATIGMTIDVQGIAMTIKDVNAPNADGIYNGLGEVSIPYFGGASFNVTFSGLYINENRVAQQGRIEFMTKGVEAMIEEQLAEQKRKEREEQQERNREDWAGTDFYNKIFYYDEIVIDSMYTNDHGEVIVVDEKGTAYVNKDISAILADAPDKAIIIEDKNGDQWVVQKDGKIARVPAGGLSPAMDVVVSEEALDLVKEALHALHLEYSGETMTTIERDLTNRRTTLDDYTKEYNRNILKSALTIEETTPQDTSAVSGGPLLFNFEDVDPSPGGSTDEEFTRLSVAAEEKELERNRGVLLNFLGNNDNIDQVNKLVAQALEVKGSPVSEYIEKEKQNRTSPDNMKSNIRNAIVGLIDSVLKETARTKSKAEL